MNGDSSVFALFTIGEQFLMALYVVLLSTASIGSAAAVRRLILRDSQLRTYYDDVVIGLLLLVGVAAMTIAGRAGLLGSVLAIVDYADASTEILRADVLRTLFVAYVVVTSGSVVVAVAIARARRAGPIKWGVYALLFNAIAVVVLAFGATAEPRNDA
jgi:hypothetical protein